MSEPTKHETAFKYSLKQDSPGATTKMPARGALLYFFALPSDLLVWLAVLIVTAAWGRKLHWLRGVWCEFKPNSWPVRTWFKDWGGTTLGHGGWYAPDHSGGRGLDTPIEVHEQTHVEQYEVGCFVGFILAVAFCLSHVLTDLAMGIGGGVAIWTLTGWMFMLAGYAVAWLRGEPVYMGSVHEEGAYAIEAQSKEGEDE